MKQKVLLLAMALLGCMNVAKAADGLTIGDVVIQQGGYNYISVKCNFADLYDAFSIKFAIPDGLHIDSGKADASLTGISSPMFPFSDGNYADIAATFMFINMQGLTFNMGNYELARIYLAADADMAVGEYPITITDLTLSGAGGTNVQLTTPTSFTVTVEAPHPRVLLDTATELPEENYSYVKVEYDTETVETDSGPKERLIEKNKEEGTVSEDFTIKRTIKANTWSTICLPFEMTEEEVYEVFGDDVQLMVNDGWSYDSDEDVIDINFYTAADYNGDNGIPANTPMLIKPSKDFSEFTVSNKILESDEEACAQEIDNGLKGKFKKTGTFQGVLKVGTIPAGSLFFSGNKFYYSTGNSNIKAFRAYLTLGDELADKAISSDGSVNVGVMFNDTPTYIDGISTRYVGNDDVYSVSGIKMGTESDLNSMKPGLYIVNGKKVIVK